MYVDKKVPNLLTDYDVMGFVAENCLVKFNSVELFKLVMKSHLEELNKSFIGYPKEITFFNFEKIFQLYTTNAVWDV